MYSLFISPRAGLYINFKITILKICCHCTLSEMCYNHSELVIRDKKYEIGEQLSTKMKKLVNENE